MDTIALRLFVASAELLNISAAGRGLGMAPAVASAKLAKLERAVGADLLHRSTRKVSLSLEGADFLPYAREIVAQEDAALAALGQGTANVQGTLRFTAPSSFAQLHIAPLLPAFWDNHPDIRLDMRLSDSQLDLIEGSFDLALRNAPLVDTSLKGRKLADDQRVLCASPGYLARAGTPIRPEDLAAHDLIAFQRDTPRPMVSKNGDRAMFETAPNRCRLVVNDGSSQRVATLAGAGISANSLWSIQADIDAGRLVRVLPEYRLEEQSVLWLMYPNSNVLSAKVRVFIDFLLEHFQPRPPWDR